MNLKRYSFLLFFQFLFLLIDLCLNSFSFLVRGDKFSIIFVFLFQDICLILSFITLVFSMYSQTGLAELLFKNFRLPLISLTFYFLLCISQHIWIISSNNLKPFHWPTALTALFILQRLFSPMYYYLYKRCALRMCDPRFCGSENLDWMAGQLAVK